MAGPMGPVPTLVEFLLGRDLETAPALRCAVLAHCLATSTLPAPYWATILNAVGTTPVCENVVVEAVSTFKDDPDVAEWVDLACHNINMPLSTRLRLCRQMGVPFRTEISAASAALLSSAPESVERLPLLDEPIYETPVKGGNPMLGGRKKSGSVGVAKPSRSLVLQGSKVKGMCLALPSTTGLLRKRIAGKLALKNATKLKEAMQVTSGPYFGPRGHLKAKVCIHRLPYTFKGKEAVNFNKHNPKQKGTLAHKRYTKYMKARTISAALALGAWKCDLVFDFHRGHMKVLNKGR